MDKEDLTFMKVVGSKAARLLRTRNPRLWEFFKKRCEENGEKPDSVLGRLALKFANSVIDGDGFADDVLSREIKLSVIVKRENIIKSIDDLIQIKKRLAIEEEDEIDKLVKSLIEAELKRATASPISMIQEKEEKPQKIVIDDNLLRQLSPEQLDQLERLVKYVKMEKVRAMKMGVEDVLKEVGNVEKGGKEMEEKEEGLGEQSEGDKGSCGGSWELDRHDTESREESISEVS